MAETRLNGLTLDAWRFKGIGAPSRKRWFVSFASIGRARSGASRASTVARRRFRASVDGTPRAAGAATFFRDFRAVLLDGASETRSNSRAGVELPARVVARVQDRALGCRAVVARRALLQCAVYVFLVSSILRGVWFQCQGELRRRMLMQCRMTKVLMAEVPRGRQSPEAAMSRGWRILAW